mmetsp:Transcript_18819/g.44696  ORF Transcript_18819/g.44696 Transcript_18819/m.44696 type:complete len:272 (-) Transcript_18819:126-941(-)
MSLAARRGVTPAGQVDPLEARLHGAAQPARHAAQAGLGPGERARGAHDERGAVGDDASVDSGGARVGEQVDHEGPDGAGVGHVQEGVRHVAQQLRVELVAKPDGRDVDARREARTRGHQCLLLLGDERRVVHAVVGLAVGRHDQVLRVARQLLGRHRKLRELPEARLHARHQIRRARDVHCVDTLESDGAARLVTFDPGHVHRGVRAVRDDCHVVVVLERGDEGVHRMLGDVEQAEAETHLVAVVVLHVRGRAHAARDVHHKAVGPLGRLN